MSKKFLSICLIVVLILSLSIFLFACDKNDEEVKVQPFDTNLLENGNFDNVNSSNEIEGWKRANTSNVSFVYNKEGTSTYDPKLGRCYLSLNSSGESYDYLVQKVALEKGAYYRIEATMKIDKILENSGYGVRLAFETETSFRGLNVVDDNDEFATYYYYFESNVSGEQSFIVAMGSKNNNASGNAFIDNISLTKVKEVPTEYIEKGFKVEILSDKEVVDVVEETQRESVVFVVLVTIASVLLLVMAICLMKSIKEDSLPLQGQDLFKKIINIFTSKFACFMYVIVGAFLVRFLITILSPGMTTNVAAMQTYAESATKNGLMSIYTKDASLTMPLGVSVLYALLGTLANAMTIKAGSLGFAMLMRLPMIISEVVTVYLIYSFATKYKDERSAAVYAGIYAFVPVFFFSSSFMTQVNMLAIPFILAAMKAMLEKDYLLTSILYTISIMFSHYLLVILPIIVVFEVIGLIYDEEHRWTITISVVVSFLVVFIISMLLTFESFKKGDIFVYFKRILQYFNSTNYLTKDAFNIYAIFGSNALKVRNKTTDVFNWLFVVALTIMPAYAYYKERNRADLVLFAAVNIIAFAAIGAAATVDIMVLGLAILLLYLVIMPENRLYAIFASLASLAFLNVAQIASQSGFITKFAEASYVGFEAKSAFIIIFSILTVLSAIYLLFTAGDIALSSQAHFIKPFKESPIVTIKKFFEKMQNKTKK